MAKYRIAWLPGEGVGIEVLEAARVVLENKTTGKSFAIEPLPKSRQAIIDAGGLIPTPFVRNCIQPDESGGPVIAGSPHAPERQPPC